MRDLQRLAGNALISAKLCDSTSQGPGQLRSSQIAQRASSPVLQRFFEALDTRQQWVSVQAADTTTGVDCSALDRVLTSADRYVLKAQADLGALAQGAKVDVLRPLRHVIGERHVASQFGRISGQWPGVVEMGEGTYTVKESALALPATRGASHDTLDDAMLAQGAGILPLENFHAAAFARLTSFLVIWNEHEHNETQATTTSLERCLRDAANLVNAYTQVAIGVKARAEADTKSLHFWGTSFAGTVEKAYGKMFDLLIAKSSIRAMRVVNDLADDVDRHARLQIVPADFAAVRKLLVKMAPLIDRILKESVAGTPHAQFVGQRISGRNLTASLGGLGAQHMAPALAEQNPLREQFMEEQIQTLPRPALVKVGVAHIVGLRGRRIPHVAFYDDFNAFDADISLDRTELP
jgi:hypothetical protein